MDKMNLFVDNEDIFNDNFITKCVQRDLEIWDIENLIDKSNPKMAELISRFGINFSDNDYCIEKYISDKYVSALPKLTDKQVCNAKEIYGELLAVPRQRVVNMAVNYYNHINSIEFRCDGIEFHLQIQTPIGMYSYNIMFYNNGQIDVLNNISNTKYIIESFSDIGKYNIFGDPDTLLSKFYWMWTYTIDRLKVKAYILALSNLTVKTYKNYLE